MDDTSVAKRVDTFIDEVISSQHHSTFWGDRMLTLDKSAGFLSEPSFKAAFEAIRGAHLYDQYSSEHTISWRLHTLVWAATAGLPLDGDFVECGVFRGDMAWVVSQTVDMASAKKRFYLYDTFDGFSRKYSSDADFPDHPGFLEFADQFFKDPTLYPTVCARFQEREDIVVVRGVVPDVLRETSVLEKIAFLHIDLNCPAAEIGALDILFPRMTAGAIAVFDDYGWKQFRRQKEAVDAFLGAKGYAVLELPTGQGLVVKR